MKTFTTSKKRAIKIAKEHLRNEHNVKRLAWSKSEGSSMQCGCGESFAIRVITLIKDKAYYHAVGICKACQND